jgi:acyl-CoA thioesterase FadM
MFWVSTTRHFSPTTARLEVDFNRPLHYGDQLEIEVTITRVGKTSIGWRYRIFRPGEAEPATEAHLVTVNMNMDAHEKREIPDWLREQLKDYKGQAEGSE